MNKVIAMKIIVSMSLAVFVIGISICKRDKKKTRKKDA